MIKLAVVALLALFALSYAQEFDLTLSHKELFAQYVAHFNVSFAHDHERIARYNIFTENLGKIEELNQDAKNKGRNTRFGLNKFSLMSQEEFRAMYLNSKMPASWIPTADAPFAPLAPQAELDGLPKSWDWRTIKPPVVTQVKNQGQCGSCYTFSTIGNVEGVWALAGHPLVALSEQNLMDCDHTCIQGVCDGGCNGGLMENAFTWVIKNGGLESEADYPYEGYNDKCRFSKSKIAASITNYTFINKTAVQMQAFLYKNGPISIAADATLWQYYITGVFYFPCGTSLDHGILIVGWGVETDMFGQTMPYWIVKNSWGADWGMDGYILVERGDDRCGLQKYPISSLILKN
jgi:cathepsin F